MNATVTLTYTTLLEEVAKWLHVDAAERILDPDAWPSWDDEYPAVRDDFRARAAAWIARFMPQPTTQEAPTPIQYELDEITPADFAALADGAISASVTVRDITVTVMAQEQQRQWVAFTEINGEARIVTAHPKMAHALRMAVFTANCIRLDPTYENGRRSTPSRLPRAINKPIQVSGAQA